LQYADKSGGYFIETCGHVVIADAPSNHPRIIGPYQPGKTVTVNLVAFLNPSKWGDALTSPIEGTNAPCPAPPAPTTGIFNAPGQIVESYFYRTDGVPDTITATATDPSIIAVSPNPFGPFECGSPCTLPPPSPTLVNVNMPDPHFQFIAGTATGTTTVTFYSAVAKQNFGTTSVTVNPTPTPAPVPKPLS
jgi:hypothetical protein